MIKQVADGIIVKVKIIPNASKNDIIVEDEFIKIKVTAQAIENKANKALINLLSKTFKIPKTQIEILKGDTSKEKTLILKSQDEEKLKYINFYLTNKA